MTIGTHEPSVWPSFFSASPAYLKRRRLLWHSNLDPRTRGGLALTRVLKVSRGANASSKDPAGCRGTVEMSFQGCLHQGSGKPGSVTGRDSPSGPDEFTTWLLSRGGSRHRRVGPESLVEPLLRWPPILGVEPDTFPRQLDLGANITFYQ